MENKLIGLILGAVVGIIIIGSLLVPVINDVSTTEKTFNNDGLYYMTNPTDAISVEYLGGTDWVINGEQLDYTVLGATNIIVFDNNFIRNVGQVRGDVTASFNNAEFTIDNGTIIGTYNDGIGTINWTYSDRCYVATNDKSAYIMKNNVQDSYIKSDSVITGIGLTTVKDADGNNQLIVIHADAVGTTATVETPTSAVTISDVSVNATPVSGYEDLYLFSSITFKATWGTNTTDCTYNIVIVPSSVTAELSQHLDSADIAVLAAIPVLMIAALVIFGVRVMYARD